MYFNLKSPMSTPIAALGALALVLLPKSAPAQGILYDFAPNSRHPHHRPDVRAAPRLILEEHRVKGEVTPSVARYRVIERFRNPSPQPVEGVYLFPIPKNATARGIALTVDGRRLEGEVIDAATAKNVYQDIVRKMKDPALLEYVGEGLLRASVFPVPGNGCVEVEIDLESPVESVGAGLLEIALPLKQAADSQARIAVDVALVADKRIDTIYSPTHQAKITRQGDNKATVCFEGTAQQPIDFRLYFAADTETGALRCVTHRGAGKDGYFLLLYEPSDDVATGAARDVVFVLDRSGSMQGEKWEQAVKALRFGIESLRPEDRFALVSFATDVRMHPETLVAATSDAKHRAIEHLEGLKAAGGTNIGDALSRAMPLLPSAADRLQLVVFVTDGLPTVGEVDPARILDGVAKANAPHARVFAFGVGYDVNTFLLDRLAEDSGADSNYVAPSQDLEVPLAAFFAKVAEPALVAPRLRFEGVEAFDVEPSRIPDLFVGDTLRVAGRFRGTGKCRVTLEGTRAGKPVVIAREIEMPAECREHAFLPGQWAARRIGHLLNEIRLHGETKELVDEVTALGKDHGIVTPYTAGLAVEDGDRGRVAGDDGRLRDGPATGGGGGGPMSPGGGPGFGAGTGPTTGGGGAMGKRKNARKDSSAPAAASGEEAVKVASELKKLERGEADAATYRESQSTKRKISDRTLNLSGTTWIDDAFKESMRTGMKEIVAFSDEYFALAAAHKELATLLALSDDLIFVLDGAAIRIKPAD